MTHTDGMTLTAVDPNTLARHDALVNVVESLKSRHDGLVLTYRWLAVDTIHLDVIALPKHDRQRGIGSQVMRELTNFALANRLRIMLVPDSCFGSDLNRLRNFYRRFGFIPDSRRNRYVFTPNPLTAPITG